MACDSDKWLRRSVQKAPRQCNPESQDDRGTGIDRKRRAAIVATASNKLKERIQLAVIGGGPAGLRAAEVAAAAGVRVTLFDAKPSVGRKFLVAGKGGLNLTHGEQAGRFETRYAGPDQPAGIWRGLLADFDAPALRGWAAGLGVETFQATSGRVYPKALKAAPLLRRWIARLKGLGVRFEMNHRWSGLTPGTPHLLEFSNGASFAADAVLFALGGGSWPQTGSDGGWLRVFETLGISCNPLVPANCGWEHPWPPQVLAAAEGQPLKNIQASAGGAIAAGELLVTRYGIEGGAIYQLGAALRAMPEPAIAIDFKPTFSHARLVAKMESVRRNFLSEARVRWRLGDAAVAILARREWHDAGSLAGEAKHCVIPLTGPRPLAEAISSAGGVCWSELDAALTVRRFPGIFVAGEMIDWEAPTGGYLMQGCFATGSRAGRAAAEWLQGQCGG
jgi:hypothetical protein